VDSKPLSILAIITLALVACSYVDGVFRVLSFGKEINKNDFYCLTDALKSQGYNPRYSPTNKSIYYQMEHVELGYVYSVSLRAFEYSDKQNEPTWITKKLLHRAIYGGSAPNACESVKPAALMLTTIEESVLPMCNLVLSKKPKQKIECKR